MKDLIDIITPKLDEICNRGGAISADDIKDIQAHAFIFTGIRIEFSDIEILVATFKKLVISKQWARLDAKTAKKNQLSLYDRVGNLNKGGTC
jgi:hypothetical protein